MILEEETINHLILILDVNIKLLEIVQDLMIATGIISFLFVYNSI